MSVLETLEICFQANLSNVDAELDRLQAMLSASADSADADAAGRRIAELFASGVNAGAASAAQKEKRIDWPS